MGIKTQKNFKIKQGTQTDRNKQKLTLPNPDTVKQLETWLTSADKSPLSGKFEVVYQCGIEPKVLWPLLVYKVTLSTAETVLYCIELFPNETSVGSALTESIMKVGRGQ